MQRALNDARTREGALRRSFVTGEPLPYQGRELRLVVNPIDCEARARADRDGDDLVVRIHPNEDETLFRAEAQSAIERWYRERAQEVFSERIRHFAPLVQATPSRLVVKD